MATIVKASNLNDYVGKVRPELWMKLINELEIVKLGFGEVIENVTSKMLMMKMEAADGVRPYRSAEDIGTDDLSYSGTELSTDVFKRDIGIDPMEYLRTPMFETTGGGDKTKIPQAQQVNEAFIGRVAKELNTTSYYGQGTANYTTYAGGAASVGDRIYFATDGCYYRCISAASSGQSPATHPSKYLLENHLAVTKGLGVDLAERIAATTVTPYSTGTLSNSNAVTKVQEMWDQLSDRYKKEKTVALMTEATWSKYKKHYRSIIQNNDGMSKISYVVPDCNENLTIIPWSGMTGSNRVIVTTYKNAKIGTDKLSDLNNIVWKDSELHRLKASIVGLLGFCWHDLSSELFVCNDAT